ncbi:hypothetical protein MNBD_GAMMA10-2765 [hydrothermal vent metagenome]|uniref:Uncharacterized protein n=1 Tax=hydrothermal vent metagenome TaxID=652676 RepID=A0A3B0XPH1_9ZZZZ
MKNHITYAIFGLLTGLVMSFIGFTDFNEVHKMFTLSDFRLIFAFMGAVGLLAMGFAILDYKKQIPKKKYNKGTVPGSVLFGIGWAITGACPIIAMIQLGEGKMAALLVIFGIYFGTWAFRRLVSGGAIGIDTGVCGE